MNREDKKSIALTGFMGVGKTSIGQALAKKTGRQLIDIDAEIEKVHQLTVPEIFREYGEAYFREKEKEMIDKYSKVDKKVLSLGGGAFLQPEVKDICMANCYVIHLELSWGKWVKRCEQLIETRPVLQGKSLEEMKALFHDREKIYQTYHLKINTDHLSIDEAAEEIILSL
ncbi:shikimate kinase [Oceanobacillus manasiensis]|uniref:shikimate kinase n=1 Tax=Oceanobacillus manasiensis TaxID=586413 RepID=UPI000AEF09A8|nr:shikimate kinase [Oceanobacillus manasiensis]